MGIQPLTPALPDSRVRRETLDFFRGELERLRFVSDIVSPSS